MKKHENIKYHYKTLKDAKKPNNVEKFLLFIGLGTGILALGYWNDILLLVALMSFFFAFGGMLVRVKKLKKRLEGR